MADGKNSEKKTQKVPAGNNQKSNYKARIISVSQAKDSTFTVYLEIHCPNTGDPSIKLPISRQIKTIPKDEAPKNWPTVLSPVYFAKDIGVSEALYENSYTGKLTDAEELLNPYHKAYRLYQHGYVYIFVNGVLWRELKVIKTNGDANKFSDVDLSKFESKLDRDARKETGQSEYRILIPYKITGDDTLIEVGFSHVQWSWVRIESLGGITPKGVKRKDWFPDEGGINKIGKEERAKRLQVISLSKNAENAFTKSIGNVKTVKDANSKDYKVQFGTEVPVIPIEDLIGDAKNLAKRYQDHWVEMQKYIDDLKDTSLKNRKKHPYARWFDTAVLANQLYFAQPRKLPDEYTLKMPLRGFNNKQLGKSISQRTEWTRYISLADIQIALGTSKRLEIREKLAQAKADLVKFLNPGGNSDVRSLSPDENKAMMMMNKASPNNTGKLYKSIIKHHKALKKADEERLHACLVDYATLPVIKNQCDDDWKCDYLQLFELIFYLIEKIEKHVHSLDFDLDTVQLTTAQLYELSKNDPGRKLVADIFATGNHFIHGMIFPDVNKKPTEAWLMGLPLKLASPLFSAHKFHAIFTNIAQGKNEWSSILRRRVKVALTYSGKTVPLLTGELRVLASDKLQHIYIAAGLRKEMFDTLNVDLLQTLSGKSGTGNYHKIEVVGHLGSFTDIDSEIDSATGKRILVKTDKDEFFYSKEKRVTSGNGFDFDPDSKYKEKLSHRKKSTAQRIPVRVYVMNAAEWDTFKRNVFKHKASEWQKASARHRLNNALLVVMEISTVSAEYAAVQSLKNKNDRAKAIASLSLAIVEASVFLATMINKTFENYALSKQIKAGKFNTPKGNVPLYTKIGGVLSKISTGINYYQFFDNVSEFWLNWSEGDDAAFANLVITSGYLLAATEKWTITTRLTKFLRSPNLATWVILAGVALLAWFFKDDTEFEKWLKNGPFSIRNSWANAHKINVKTILDYRREFKTIQPTAANKYSSLYYDSGPPRHHRIYLSKDQRLMKVENMGGYFRETKNHMHRIKDYQWTGKFIQSNVLKSVQFGQKFDYSILVDHKQTEKYGSGRFGGFNESKFIKTMKRYSDGPGAFSLTYGEPPVPGAKQFYSKYGKTKRRYEFIEQKDFISNDVRWWYTRPQLSTDFLLNHLYRPYVTKFEFIKVGNKNVSKAPIAKYVLFSLELQIPNYIINKTKIHGELWIRNKFADKYEYKIVSNIKHLTFLETNSKKSGPRICTFNWEVPGKLTGPQADILVKYRIDLYGDGKVLLPCSPDYNEQQNKKESEEDKKTVSSVPFISTITNAFDLSNIYWGKVRMMAEFLIPNHPNPSPRTTTSFVMPIFGEVIISKTPFTKAVKIITEENYEKQKCQLYLNTLPNNESFSFEKHAEYAKQCSEDSMIRRYSSDTTKPKSEIQKKIEEQELIERNRMIDNNEIVEKKE